MTKFSTLTSFVHGNMRMLAFIFRSWNKSTSIFLLSQKRQTEEDKVRTYVCYKIHRAKIRRVHVRRLLHVARLGILVVPWLIPSLFFLATTDEWMCRTYVQVYSKRTKTWRARTGQSTSCCLRCPPPFRLNMASSASRPNSKQGDM